MSAGRLLLADRHAAIEARDVLAVALLELGCIAPADVGLLYRLLHEAECIAEEVNLMAVDLMVERAAYARMDWRGSVLRTTRQINAVARGMPGA